MEKKTYKIEFIDEYTKGGKVSVTTSDMFDNEQDVINFYGLNQPDVKWYKITEIEHVL